MHDEFYKIGVLLGFKYAQQPQPRQQQVAMIPRQPQPPTLPKQMTAYDAGQNPLPMNPYKRQNPITWHTQQPEFQAGLTRAMEAMGVRAKESLKPGGTTVYMASPQEQEAKRKRDVAAADDARAHNVQLRQQEEAAKAPKIPEWQRPVQLPNKPVSKEEGEKAIRDLGAMEPAATPELSSSMPTGESIRA